MYELTSKDSTIKAYDGTEVAPPSVQLQVAMFLRHLNDTRFATFKTSVKSDFHQVAIAYPKTIDEAFLRFCCSPQIHSINSRCTSSSYPNFNFI
jgi:hypothetical protein